MQKGAPPELKVSDVFDHFRSMGIKLYSQCNFPLDFIHEACEILRVAFGEDWIKKVSTEHDKGSPLIPDLIHPIGSHFAVCGANQLSELLELVIYLKSLVKVPGLNDVITNMKNDYDSGLLQLSFAWRFKQAGATSLELEPPTTKGKADIAFEYENTPYVVECYTPRSSDPAHFEYQMALKGLQDLAEESPKKLRISIRFKSPLDPTQRKRICFIAQEIIERINANEEKIVCEECCELKITDISEIDRDNDFLNGRQNDAILGDPDFFMAFSKIERSRVKELRTSRIEEMDPERGTRLFGWYPQRWDPLQEFRENVEKLIQKIKKKVSQASTPSKKLKIIIIEIPPQCVSASELDPFFVSIQQRIVKEHKDISCLIFVSRIWGHNFRHRIIAKFFGGPPPNAIPETLFKKLSEIEEHADILLHY